MKYENNKIVYEVGDWVTYTEGDGYFEIEEEIGLTDRVVHIEKDGWVAFSKRKSKTYSGYNHWRPTCFRPATQREIDKALGNEKIFIGEYEVKFPDKDCIMVGCQKVDKEQFLKIGKKAGWL